MAGPAETNLVSLRWLLSLFFGGVGSLLPFLSLHARSVGLTIEESRFISIISPLFAFFGPVIAGPLVDQLSSKRRNEKNVNLDHNGLIRTILSSTILLSAICYSLLLSVPLVERREPRQSAVSFLCGEDGAFLVQERCNQMSCYQYPSEKIGTISLLNCRFDCSSHYYNHEAFQGGKTDQDSIETEVEVSTARPITTTPTEETSTVELVKEHDMDMNKFFGSETSLEDEDDDDVEFGSGEDSTDWFLRRQRRDEEEEEDGETTPFPLPPHICFGSSTTRLCSVYTPYSSSINVNISMKQAFEEKESCFYPLATGFSCRIPQDLEKQKDSCKTLCDLENAFAPDSLLLQSQCERTVGDPNLTFWLYLLFRGLGDFFIASSISLLIGATLTAARQDIGREFMLPTATFAIFSSLSGYLHSQDLSPLRFELLKPYFLAIITYGIYAVISVFVLIFSTELPIGPPDWWSSSRVLRMRHKTELFGLLLILTFLGFLWGPHFSHVPWHLHGTKGLELYVGGSLALGAVLSLPLLWKANFIVDYCGYSNLLIAAFAFYILRYTGLLFLKTPWVLFVTGSLEVFSLSLMIMTAILYIRHLVPKHLMFTAQCFGFAAHFCLGNGLGCLISTLLSPSSLLIESTAIRNATLLNENEEEEGPYNLLYRCGAVFAAAIGIIYFLCYHCCFKKRCLAPTHRKTSESPPLVQGSAINGTYTPLQVIRNGHQQQAEQ